MRNRPSTITAGFVLAAACQGGCAALRDRQAEVAIPRVLTRQAAAWNAGDIETFMTPYWHSPKLAFVSGGTITRGWEPTLARYRSRYPSRAAMGTLAFSEIEVHELARRSALVLGRWRLDRKPPEQPVGGRFTLLFRRIDGDWVIVYDHTSTE